MARPISTRSSKSPIPVIIGAGITEHFSNSHAVEKELKSFIPQYEKTESFLQNRKWVEDMTAGGKLDAAVDRAKKYRTAQGSYSNVYQAIEML